MPSSENNKANKNKKANKTNKATKATKANKANKANNERVFIIAEAGINHNGKLSIAKNLIDEALDVGADAVKFQSFKASSLVSASSDKAQYNLLKELELSPSEQRSLFDYCSAKDIVFLSSPFDKFHVDLLYDFGISSYKVASSELTNIPLLEHIASKGKPIFLSTGMSSLFEIEEALLSIFKIQANIPVTLLHCVSLYPAPIESINLSAMRTIKEAFKLPVGYSDHSLGIDIPIAAVALGAICIEKHFTLDKNMKGPDHGISLDAEEFRRMVISIRSVGLALGDGLKKPVLDELKVRRAARSSLVSNYDIDEGVIVNRDMFCMKRPGTGIPYKFLDILLGKSTIRAIKKDSTIVWDDFF